MNIDTNNTMKSLIAESALRLVFDPEIGINIIDLGLVYAIHFDEEQKKVNVTMTLTTEFCPMGESIVHNAGEALKSAFPEYQAGIELTFDPPWNHERISEDGNQFLTM